MTALLAYAAMTLIGDRVEGIGICILTDYDSGYGGEEAIYMSLGASIAWLTAMVFNIIGSFGADEPVSKSGKVGLSAAGGILSLTDANGKEIRAEGAPYKLHYVYSQSEQLTGDYTIPAGVFPFPVSGTSIPSDDLGTNISFFEDGTYLFTFDSYGILDAGTWTFEKGVLTLTDVNGVQYIADGETLHLHYGYSGAPDQLTGDYSIDPEIFG